MFYQEGIIFVCTHVSRNDNYFGTKPLKNTI